MTDGVSWLSVCRDWQCAVIGSVLWLAVCCDWQCVVTDDVSWLPVCCDRQCCDWQCVVTDGVLWLKMLWLAVCCDWRCVVTARCFVAASMLWLTILWLAVCCDWRCVVTARCCRHRDEAEAAAVPCPGGPHARAGTAGRGTHGQRHQVRILRHLGNAGRCAEKSRGRAARWVCCHSHGRINI